MDIDISVVVSPKNMQQLVLTTQELDLKPMLPVPLETQTQIDTLKEWHAHRNLQAFSLHGGGPAGVSLDILLFPPIDPAAMCQRAIKLDVAGVPVVLATIDDLITLKQSAGRPIDLSDIEHLHRIDKPGAIPP